MVCHSTFLHEIKGMTALDWLRHFYFHQIDHVRFVAELEGMKEARMAVSTIAF